MLPLSAVVVSYNTGTVTLRCLAAAVPAIEALGGMVVVVDNASPDGSADLIAREFPGVRLIRMSRNRGFAAGVNAGIAAVPSKRVLLLNPDCFLDGPDAVKRCLDLLDADSSIGATGCRLVDRDGEPMLYARAFPTLRGYFAERFGLARAYPPVPDPPEPVEVDSIIGAFLMIDRGAFERVGPLDEGFFLYFEETDWCWRARECGYRLVVDPRITVVHWGGESTRRRDEEPVGPRGLLMGTYLDSRERFWRKCYGRVATLQMRAAGLAISAIGLLLAMARGAKERAAMERFRIRHALHLVHGLRG